MQTFFNNIIFKKTLALAIAMILAATVGWLIYLID